jgi:hypothetical protein
MTKELLEYLGLKESEIKTIDDFKSTFDKTFIRTAAINGESEVVKHEVGKVFSQLDAETKKLAKAHGVELGDDYKQLKFINEKVDYILKKKDESYGAKITELQGQVGKSSEEVVKTWEEKYGKLKNKYSETEEMLNNVKTEYEGFKVNSSKELKSVKLNTLIAKELEGLKLKSTITPIEKKGFMAEINDKYNFDLDETDKLIVVDKTTGKRPVSTKIAGEYKSPIEVLSDEAIAAKVFQDNNDGGKKAPLPFNTGQQTQHQQQSAPARVVAPRLGA